MRLEDLPPRLQAQVAAKLGAQIKRPTKSRAGVGLAEPCPGHCGCGEAFPNAATWERHAADTGCSRWSIDLGDYDAD